MHGTHFYTKQMICCLLEFRFNWASYILSGKLIPFTYMLHSQLSSEPTFSGSVFHSSMWIWKYSVVLFFSLPYFIFKKFLLEYSWLTNVLVSGVQQNDSIIYVHVSDFQILFPFRLLQNIEESFLCYTVDAYWLSKYSNVYMSIPNSRSIDTHWFYIVIHLWDDRACIERLRGSHQYIHVFWTH